MSPSVDPRAWTIEGLRREFLAHDLSGELWTWLLSVLGIFVRGRLAPRYRAAVFSPSGQWDREGIDDLVNDFLVELGIRKGLILRALARTDSTSAFIGYLERSLHRFVLAERGQSVGRNIYHRLHAVLAEHPDLCPLAGVGRDAAYGHRDWSEDPPPVADPEALRGAERYIPADVRTTEYRIGPRRSPMLERDALGMIAVSLIRGTKSLLSARQVLEVIGRRYDLREAESVPGGDDVLAGISTAELDPLQTVVAEEMAERLLHSLTERQREVLRHWIDHPPPTAREVADRTGLKKSTVNNEQRAITAQARRLGLTSFEERAQVLSIISGMLEPDPTVS
jgi:DNA-binding CsgD family transcriptional regulator